MPVKLARRWAQQRLSPGVIVADMGHDRAIVFVPFRSVFSAYHFGDVNKMVVVSLKPLQWAPDGASLAHYVGIDHGSFKVLMA